MKRIVVSAAVLSLAVTGVSAAQAAPSVYKITGGGQIIDLETQSGAGDTVAFSAQSAGPEGAAAKGQFQYVDRTQDATGKGTGKGQNVYHGEVTCAFVSKFPGADQSGGVGVLGGTLRDGTPFRVDVMDDGQGRDALDVISVRLGDEARDGGDDDNGDTDLCDKEDESPEGQLARGNVKIHKQR